MQAARRSSVKKAYCENDHFLQVHMIFKFLCNHLGHAVCIINATAQSIGAQDLCIIAANQKGKKPAVCWALCVSLHHETFWSVAFQNCKDHMKTVNYSLKTSDEIPSLNAVVLSFAFVTLLSLIWKPGTVVIGKAAFYLLLEFSLW